MVLGRMCLQCLMRSVTCYVLFFFFGNPGYPGQFTCTTTNSRTHWTPCKPSRQVRHRGGDRRVRWGSNPGDRGKENLTSAAGLQASVHTCYVLARPGRVFNVWWEIVSVLFLLGYFPSLFCRGADIYAEYSCQIFFISVIFPSFYTSDRADMSQ